MSKRLCACGCGKAVRSKNPRKRFLNEAHRNAAWARTNRPPLSRRVTDVNKRTKP